MSDGKALLAKATSETLREDARYLRQLLRETHLGAGSHRHGLARLAALAEAVAAWQERRDRWVPTHRGTRIDDYGYVAFYAAREGEDSIPAALSTLLSPPAEVRNDK